MQPKNMASVSYYRKGKALAKNIWISIYPSHWLHEPIVFESYSLKKGLKEALFTLKG